MKWLKTILIAKEMFKGTKPLQGEDLALMNEFTDRIIPPAKNLKRR